jgi:hypothetical protein
MFERHRDKNGEISRKHGNTLIGTLRKHYGKDFLHSIDPLRDAAVTSLILALVPFTAITNAHRR